MEEKYLINELDIHPSTETDGIDESLESIRDAMQFSVELLVARRLKSLEITVSTPTTMLKDATANKCDHASILTLSFLACKESFTKYVLVEGMYTPNWAFHCTGAVWDGSYWYMFSPANVLPRTEHYDRLRAVSVGRSIEECIELMSSYEGGIWPDGEYVESQAVDCRWSRQNGLTRVPYVGLYNVIRQRRIYFPDEITKMLAEIQGD